MDLDKFRKAKADKDALIAERQEKERQRKAKQEAIIKKYVDMLTEPILEKRIAAITDEELDDILAEDIFSNDIESDTFNLPIIIYEDFIEIGTSQYVNTTSKHKTLEMHEEIHSRACECHICNHKAFDIKLNDYIEGIYYCEEGSGDVDIDEDCDSDIKELGIGLFDRIEKALDQIGLKKLKTDGDYPDDCVWEDNNYNIYYNGLNDTRIIEALTKRLQEYGLIILDTQTELDLDLKYRIKLEVIYKIKNPLK